MFSAVVESDGCGLLFLRLLLRGDVGLALLGGLERTPLLLCGLVVDTAAAEGLGLLGPGAVSAEGLLARQPMFKSQERGLLLSSQRESRSRRTARDDRIEPLSATTDIQCHGR